ncbi:MAG: type II secretion system protein GspN [Proteobacteria bacterium]|nr:type II secretion system protein GspN [Pseudomonadota bacterium]
MIKHNMAILNKKNTFYALYAMGAFLFFLWFLFPSDFFADYLETLIQQQGQGVVVTIKEARPSLPFALSLKGVEGEIPGGPMLKAESLRISPGLISLFGVNPKVSFSSRIFGGKVSGTVTFPEKNPKKPSVESIRISGLDLFELKDILTDYLPGYTLKGELDATGDYSSDGRGNGALNLLVKDLVVAAEKPFFTIKDLTFPEISVEMEIKSKKVQIERCVIDGKEVDGTLSGSVFIRNPFDRSTLRLSGTLKPEKTFMEKLGANVPIEALIGKKMNADGEIPFSISGVASAPRYSLK